MIENVAYWTHSAPLFKTNNVSTMQQLMHRSAAITIFHNIKLNENEIFAFLKEGAYNTKKVLMTKILRAPTMACKSNLIYRQIS